MIKDTVAKTTGRSLIGLKEYLEEYLKKKKLQKLPTQVSPNGSV